MSHFKAPKHVTSIFTGGNEYRADKNGLVSLPNDEPAADVHALLSAGWTRVESASAPANEPHKAKAAKKAKGAAKHKRIAAEPAAAPNQPAAAQPELPPEAHHTDHEA